VSAREELLSRTFVALADTMVNDFDLVEFLSTLTERCVELFDVEAAGLMLAGPQGELQLMASSSERMRLLELFELQRQQGPCPDCYKSGKAIDEPDLATAVGRWPAFAPEASRVGFHAVAALPLRLRQERIGALNLFRSHPGRMAEADLIAAQALADVAAIGLLQHRAGREARLLAEQLSDALNARVTIEQAKGVLAERLQIAVDEAYSLLRVYALDRQVRLAEVARQVVNAELGADQLQRRALVDDRPPEASGAAGVGI
jgi:GAF domain-containing protein